VSPSSHLLFGELGVRHGSPPPVLVSSLCLSCCAGTLRTALLGELLPHKSNRKCRESGDVGIPGRRGESSGASVCLWEQRTRQPVHSRRAGWASGVNGNWRFRLMSGWVDPGYWGYYFWEPGLSDGGFYRGLVLGLVSDELSGEILVTWVCRCRAS
jgi:hypothetical protein